MNVKTYLVEYWDAAARSWSLYRSTADEQEARQAYHALRQDEALRRNGAESVRLTALLEIDAR